MGLDIGGTNPPTQPNKGNTGGDLLGGLGGFNFTPTQTNYTQPQTQPVQSKGFDSLLDDGLLGGGGVKQPTPVFTQPQPQTNLGFDFLGTGMTTTTTPPPVNPTNNFLGQPTQFTQPQVQPQVQQQGQSFFKFKAYETPHVEIWM